MNLDHNGAMNAITGAAGVSILSYEEAIEAYLRLRGWSVADLARPPVRQTTGAEPDAAASLKGEPPQPLPDTPSQPSGEGGT